MNGSVEAAGIFTAFHMWTRELAQRQLERQFAIPQQYPARVFL